MSPLRLAIVGGGHLGRIHAKLAEANDQFELVSVADPSHASRKLVEEQLGVPVTENYQDLLGKIDAAVVAAPTTNHYEVTSELLRAGVHCLVEKPLATSPDQADRLVQIAKSHDRVLQVGHVERFNPTWTAAQAQIGAPKFIQAVRCGPYSGRSTDIGVVMDLMIHDLDLILSIDHSPVTSVIASGIAVLGSQEDIAEARIEFASGCIATLRASRLAYQATREMQIYSAAGLAEIDFSSDRIRVTKPTPELLTRSVALDELGAEERMQAKSRIFDDYLKPLEIPAPKRNAILDEHNDFALSIQSGSTPAVSGEDGARAVRVASDILQAVAAHAWDGANSKPWRVGALATTEPRILPISAGSQKVPATQPATRRAG